MNSPLSGIFSPYRCLDVHRICRRPSPSRVITAEVEEYEIEPTAARVSVEVPGLMTQLYASEGSRLAAGDTLLMLFVVPALLSFLTGLEQRAEKSGRAQTNSP